MKAAVVSAVRLPALSQQEIARRWASRPGNAVVRVQDRGAAVDWVFLTPLASWCCQDGTKAELERSFQEFFGVIDDLSVISGNGIPYCAGFISYEAGAVVWGGAPARHGQRTVPYGCCTLYQTVLECRTEGSVEYQVQYEELPSFFQSASAPGAWAEQVGGSLTAFGDLAENVEQYGSLSAKEFGDAVNAARESIRNGDVYQVNLSIRFSLPPGTESLREIGVRFLQGEAADRRALISEGNALLLSASPELFYTCRGNSIRCSPIKGTRPRVGMPDIDNIRVRELQASAKEKAELAMIVDLVRNDLNRICVPGSVQVDCHARVEQHHSVFHTVTDVTGILESRVTAENIWSSLFPCGSITGAPKRSAVAQIRGLEPHLREAYCGAIGMFGFDMTAHWNVAIRTAMVTPERSYLYAGSGITIDSDPLDEYQEVLTKLKPSLSTVLEGPRHTTVGPQKGPRRRSA